MEVYEEVDDKTGHTVYVDAGDPSNRMWRKPRGATVVTRKAPKAEGGRTVHVSKRGSVEVANAQGPHVQVSSRGSVTITRGVGRSGGGKPVEADGGAAAAPTPVGDGAPPAPESPSKPDGSPPAPESPSKPASTPDEARARIRAGIRAKRAKQGTRPRVEADGSAAATSTPVDHTFRAKARARIQAAREAHAHIRRRDSVKVTAASDGRFHVGSDAMAAARAAVRKRREDMKRREAGGDPTADEASQRAAARSQAHRLVAEARKKARARRARAKDMRRREAPDGGAPDGGAPDGGAPDGAPPDGQDTDGGDGGAPPAALPSRADANGAADRLVDEVRRLRAQSAADRRALLAMRREIESLRSDPEVQARRARAQALAEARKRDLDEQALALRDAGAYCQKLREMTPDELALRRGARRDELRYSTYWDRWDCVADDVAPPPEVGGGSEAGGASAAPNPPDARPTRSPDPSGTSDGPVQRNAPSPFPSDASPPLWKLLLPVERLLSPVSQRLIAGARPLRRSAAEAELRGSRAGHGSEAGSPARGATAPPPGPWEGPGPASTVLERLNALPPSPARRATAAAEASNAPPTRGGPNPQTPRGIVSQAALFDQCLERVGLAAGVVARRVREAGWAAAAGPAAGSPASSPRLGRPCSDLGRGEAGRALSQELATSVAQWIWKSFQRCSTGAGGVSVPDAAGEAPPGGGGEEPPAATSSVASPAASPETWIRAVARNVIDACSGSEPGIIDVDKFNAFFERVADRVDVLVSTRASLAQESADAERAREADGAPSGPREKAAAARLLQSKMTAHLLNEGESLLLPVEKQLSPASRRLILLADGHGEAPTGGARRAGPRADASATPMGAMLAAARRVRATAEGCDAADAPFSDLGLALDLAARRTSRGGDALRYSPVVARSKLLRARITIGAGLGAGRRSAGGPATRPATWPAPLTMTSPRRVARRVGRGAVGAARAALRARASPLAARPLAASPLAARPLAASPLASSRIPVRGRWGRARAGSGGLFGHSGSGSARAQLGTLGASARFGRSGPLRGEAGRWTTTDRGVLPYTRDMAHA